MRLHTRDQSKEGQQEAQTPFTVRHSHGLLHDMHCIHAAGRCLSSVMNK